MIPSMGLSDRDTELLAAALAGLDAPDAPWSALSPLARLGGGGTDVTIDRRASARLGAPVILARPRPALPEGLTPRQAEIARACAMGLGNKEIALRLGLSPATVKDHVAAILARLGLRNRREIAWVMLGLSHGSEP